MPTLAHLVPDRVPTAAEERAIAEGKPGLLSQFGHGLALTTPGNLYRSALRWQNLEDPDFRLTDELLESLTKGVPEHLWGGFEDARSLADARQIRENLLMRSASEQRLAEAGWTGTALRIAADVADPAFLAAGVAATAALGPVGTGAVVAGRVNRLRSLIRGGLIATAIDTPLTAYNVSQDPEAGIDDFAVSALSTFVLGGVVGLWADTALSRAAARDLKRLEHNDVVHAMGAASPFEIAAQRLEPSTRKMLDAHVFTDKGKAYFSEVATEAEQRRIIDSLIERSGLDPVEQADEIAELRNLDPATALQRLAEDPIAGGDIARTGVIDREASLRDGGGEPIIGNDDAPPPLPPKEVGDFDLSGLTSNRSMWTPVRFSMAGRLGASESPQLRKLATALAQDALPKVGPGGKPAPSIQAASEWVTINYGKRVAAYYREALPELRDHLRAHGGTRDRFFEMVGEVVRGAPPPSPEVRKVAALQAKLQSELLSLAQRHGVKGFDKVTENANYLMRIWSPARLAAATERFGQDAVERFFANAIRSYSDGMTEDVAQKIAKAFIRGVDTLGRRTEIDKAIALTEDGREILKEMLEEAGLSADDVGNILAATTPDTSGAGLTPRARRRIGLDENHRETLTAANGEQVPLRMADLLENNAESIFQIYTRQMVGAAAEAEVIRAFKAGADDTITSFDTVVRRVRREMEDLGIPRKQIERDLSKIETLHRHVRGLPLSSQGAWGDVGRTVRGFNHLRLSGGFGFAQLPETANIIGEMGVRAAFRQMPALRQVFTRAKSGRLENELLDEIENVLAVGVDRLNNQVTARFSAHEGLIERAGGRIDRPLRSLNRAASDLSGAAHITMASQRMAGAAAAQRVTDLAWAGRSLSERRLASLGLTEGDWKAIAAQVKKHSVTEQGILGRKLRRLNLEAWDDRTAAAKLIVGLDKWSRSAIQTNDIGQLSQWMTSDMGRIITQFRAFTIAAYEKQLLQRLAVRDTEAFVSLAAASVSAALVYVGQTYIQSIGRADREEFLRERLAPNVIARMAFQRGGYSSLLPPVIDNVNWATGGEQMFGIGRQTGLTSVGLLSNPTFALFDSVPRSLRAGGRAVREQLGGAPDAFTQPDARALSALLPFRNLIGVKNAIDAWITRLPEQEPRE